MVMLLDVHKSFAARRGRLVIADGITTRFPRGRATALMGRNGAGKSTLLAMIAGAIQPNSGQIFTDGTVSFPVGFAGSFHRDLTGAQNTRFIARVYGVDTDALLDYVQEFAALGRHIHMPVRTYSSGMRSRLAFGISMGIRFDTYLVDEVTSVGDRAFRRKSATVFADRMKNASAIVVTHSFPEARNLCDAGAIIDKGKLTFYNDIEEAIDRHTHNMALAS